MAAEIESQYGVQAELIKAAGGKFEVVADGKLLFSKMSEGRFPENQEVLVALAKRSAKH